MARCRECGDERDISCQEYRRDELEFDKENAGDFAGDQWFQSERPSGR